MPRKFDENEIIYDEEDDVPEIYFIMEGTIGVGFRTPTRNHTDFRLIKYFREDSFVCDFYVCANRKSEFVYQSVKETKTFALQKNFLVKLFQKYPEIGNKIKKDSQKRYMRTIRNPLLEQRVKEIEDFNEKSAYKIIRIENKVTLKNDENKKKDAYEFDLGEEFKKITISDLHNILKTEMKRVNTEMDDITNCIKNFQESTDEQLEIIMNSLDTIQNVVTQIK